MIGQDPSARHKKNSPSFERKQKAVHFNRQDRVHWAPKVQGPSNTTASHSKGQKEKKSQAECDHDQAKKTDLTVFEREHLLKETSPRLGRNEGHQSLKNQHQGQGQPDIIDAHELKQLTDPGRGVSTGAVASAGTGKGMGMGMGMGMGNGLGSSAAEQAW
jgi:hypothetical protein